MPKELKQISFTLELPKHLVVSLNAIYSGAHWHKRHEIKEGYKALTRVLFKELAEKFGIMSIPTLLVFKNGKLVKTAVGLHDKGGLADMVK